MRFSVLILSFIVAHPLDVCVLANVLLDKGNIVSAIDELAPRFPAAILFGHLLLELDSRFHPARMADEPEAASAENELRDAT